MSRLRTQVGDLALVNPVICGSGEHVMTAAGIRAALAAGAAGVIAKSLNESPIAARQLDIADYALVRPDNTLAAWGTSEQNLSLFCRSGLAQTTAEEWFALVAALDREAMTTDRFVAASIIPAAIDVAVELADCAGKAGIRVLELNIGSPQSLEAAPGTILLESDEARLKHVVGRVRAAFGGRLWVKLPGLGTNLPELGRAAREAGADAVGMVGRFMAMLPDVETLAPVLGTSAGYSGGWALPITCRWLAMTRQVAGRAVPLIGTNGARSGLDVARFMLAGASAVELTSVVLQSGFAALGEIIAELDAYLARKRLNAAELVGHAADTLQTYQEQTPHPGRWRDFVPRETLA
jgi:dihydroorotate dehydrogenase (NAD+) catalytic subunit